jgi:hypothetical protein
MPITDVLSWLRTLIEDLPVIARDTAAADGATTAFFVKNAPMSASPAPMVAINGVSKAEGVDYAVTAERSGIVFPVAPVADAQVTVVYGRQTFDDAELQWYIGQAQTEWTLDRHVVYRAAIYVIDSMLMGMATAMHFGAGAEDFDLPSVYQRLTQLRALWTTALEGFMDEPTIQIVDVIFPSRDPTYPGGFYGDDLDEAYDPTILP